MNMEIVMIKKQGCMPCEIFKPTIEKYALEKGIDFRTIQAEDMPESIRPEFYPYFYLRSGDEILEEWGGTHERKMETVIKRHLN
jgi:thiol-disulfide isomerase/thioredoxin